MCRVKWNSSKLSSTTTKLQTRDEMPQPLSYTLNTLRCTRCIIMVRSRFLFFWIRRNNALRLPRKRTRRRNSHDVQRSITVYLSPVWLVYSNKCIRICESTILNKIRWILLWCVHLLVRLGHIPWILNTILASRMYVRL